MVAEVRVSGVTETAEPSLYVGANTAGGACDTSTAAGSPGTLRSLTDDHLPCVGPSVDNSLVRLAAEEELRVHVHSQSPRTAPTVVGPALVRPHASVEPCSGSLATLARGSSTAAWGAVPCSVSDSGKHLNLLGNKWDASDVSVVARVVKPLCLWDTRGMGGPVVRRRGGGSFPPPSVTATSSSRSSVSCRRSRPQVLARLEVV